MTFNRPKWKDPDWCDRNVVPAGLVDDEVIEAAARVDRYSNVLIDLLNEGCKRRLAGMVPIARQHLAHPDPFAVTAAVGVLEALGDASDVTRLERLVPGAADHYLLAAILEAMVTLDPTRWQYALEAAAAERDDGYFDTRYVTASVMVRLAEVLPDDVLGLDALLIEWATDSRLAPIQQEAIFRRLAAMPRTDRVENFLVAFYNEDDGAYPNLTRIVDEALGVKGVNTQIAELLDRLGQHFPGFCASLRAGHGDPIEQVLAPANTDLIDGIERELGVPLPGSYKAFMLCSAGFWLLGGCVKFHVPFFHDFPPIEQLTPVQRQTLDAKGSVWPPPSQGMLCIADFFWRADGDQVLFDVRPGFAGGEYAVVYYDHESSPPTAQRVAGSFSGWIEGCLSVFTEEE